MGLEDLHMSTLPIEYIGADTTIVGKAQLAPCDQVDGGVVLAQVDVGSLTDPFKQGLLHRPAGGVGGVNDASVGMSALLGEVVAVILAGEGDSLVDEPADSLAAAGYRVLHGGWPAQVGAGDQGVLDMGFDAVLLVQYCGDPALGEPGGAASGALLLSTQMLAVSGRFSARVNPAAPLPIIRTSISCSLMAVCTRIPLIQGSPIMHPGAVGGKKNLLRGNLAAVQGFIPSGHSLPGILLQCVSSERHTL